MERDAGILLTMPTNDDGTGLHKVHHRQQQRQPPNRQQQNQQQQNPVGTSPSRIGPMNPFPIRIAPI